MKIKRSTKRFRKHSFKDKNPLLVLYWFEYGSKWPSLHIQVEIARNLEVLEKFKQIYFQILGVSKPICLKT